MHKHFPEAKAHDRWTLVFTAVIAISTLAYAILAGWTLIEIHSGSKDTHNLAVAAAQQESHTEEIAQASQDQVDAANEISDAADSFSDTASTAVEEFKKAAADSAKISKQSAKTAEETMHTSERAYVAVANAQFDLSKGTVQAVEINTGRMPSGQAETTVHYLVVNTPIVNEPFNMTTQSVETHWRRHRNLSIPVGSPFSINQTFSTIDANLVKKGHQRIIMVGFTNYNDGFPDTPMQRSTFCYEEIYSTGLQEFVSVTCDFVSYLPAAEEADGYPEKEEH
jgi:hypothetical protein